MVCKIILYICQVKFTLLMKYFIAPTFSTPQNMRSLKRHLRRKGIKTESEAQRPEHGHLGRGIATGLSTILTGGEGFFTKLGEAIVKYVELKKVDVSMKNNKGEEITLSAALPKNEIRAMLNEFFDRSVTVSKPLNTLEMKQKKTTEPRKPTKKKTTTTTTTKTEKKAPVKTANTKSTTTRKKPTTSKKKLVKA